MKKNYLFGMLALAAMTMVGCSNDEVVNDYSQDNAIQFGTYVGRDASSRAIVIDNAKLATDGFGVFAYYHQGTKDAAGTYTASSKPDFMYNQEVTGVKGNDGNYTWSYSPVKYWPNNLNDRVSFLAYAPYDANANIETLAENNTSIKFLVEETVTKQIDLLYLCQEENTINLEKQAIKDRVQFHFLHALSRIGFNAEVMVDMVNNDQTGDKDDNMKEGSEGITYQEKVELADGTKIVINKVTFSGNFYKQGILNLYGGAWTPTTPSGVTNFVLTKEDNFGQGDPSYTFTNTDKKNKRPLNSLDSYIMIIPQDFTDVEKNGTLTVTVDYDVFTADAALPEVSGWGKGSLVNNVITSDPFIVDFKQGKAYNFTLHIGMTSVELSATVEGWGDPEDIVVNVPLNKGSN